MAGGERERNEKRVNPRPEVGKFKVGHPPATLVLFLTDRADLPKEKAYSKRSNALLASVHMSPLQPPFLAGFWSRVHLSAGRVELRK